MSIPLRMFIPYSEKRLKNNTIMECNRTNFEQTFLFMDSFFQFFVLLFFLIHIIDIGWTVGVFGQLCSLTILSRIVKGHNVFTGCVHHLDVIYPYVMCCAKSFVSIHLEGFGHRCVCFVSFHLAGPLSIYIRIHIRISLAELLFVLSAFSLYIYLYVSLLWFEWFHSLFTVIISSNAR